MACEHIGYHSGRARYLPASGELQLSLVCDECGSESVRLERIDYSPPPQRAPADGRARADRPGLPPAPGAKRRD